MGVEDKDFNGMSCEISLKKKGWFARFLEKLADSRGKDAECVA